MLPVLLVAFIPSIISAQSQTLFIKKRHNPRQKLGTSLFRPSGEPHGFRHNLHMLTTIVFYDRFFIPTARRYTKNPRGITLLQRFGIGLVLHIIIISLTASFTKRKRLNVARAHGVFGKNETVPLTVFISLPQFTILGLTDVFLEISKQQFFYDQAPEGMKSLGASFFTTRKGVGNFLGTLILTTVSDITKRHGHGGWVLDNLNVSHLDYYYAFLAVLAFLNFLSLCLLLSSLSTMLMSRNTIMWI